MSPEVFIAVFIIFAFTIGSLTLFRVGPLEWFFTLIKGTLPLLLVSNKKAFDIMLSALNFDRESMPSDALGWFWGLILLSGHYYAPWFRKARHPTKLWAVFSVVVVLSPWAAVAGVFSALVALRLSKEKGIPALAALGVGTSVHFTLTQFEPIQILAYGMAAIMLLGLHDDLVQLLDNRGISS